ncbi:unnamed protein product [Parnassius mnemosyne]|uniref:C2H2-type domain-containing protein n=1 Tax=Parnassius mnemosyne TaxID=213953 RepID=A0AAV1LKG3_9NEOP
MNRYYKNVILCGEIDFYCLLCEESFELAEQVERHIRWEQHRKNIKNLSYIPKYKKDCIFMIGKYYYCEICNYVTTSVKQVKNHINDSTHLFRTKNPIITQKASDVTRNKNGLIKYHNMIMSKFEWHGIVNNHCFLCNTSVENVEHVKQRDHMIALVQSEMRKVKENEYNRKVKAF